MANWVGVLLEFTGTQPAEAEVRHLRLCFKILDYDFPDLTPEGYQGVWRSPLIGVKWVVSVLTRVGFPARGCYAVEDFYTGEYVPGRWIEPEVNRLDSSPAWHEFYGHYLRATGAPDWSNE